MAGTTLNMNDVLEHRVQFYNQGQLGEFTSHWLVTATGGASLTDADMLPLLRPGILANIVSIIPNVVSYRGHVMQVIYPVRKVAAVDTTGQGPCGNTHGPLPMQTSGLIATLTSLAGRAYRGRLFIPFPATDAITPPLDTPTPGYQGFLQTFANTYFQVWTGTVGANSCTITPVIYHRKAGKTGTPAAHSTSNITRGIARGVWATQRRRGDLGRENAEPL